MEGLLKRVAVLLVLVSFGHAVNLRQECDIGLQVGCPSEADEQPWVSCSQVSCSVTTQNTWFIGALYKRVDCLEADGKMVKVEYQRQGRLSCSLVPIQTNEQLLAEYLDPSSVSCGPPPSAPDARRQLP
ncbi:uncharacterized protein LOC125032601 [Penaeus chinensis]|uniref:uncharacterized protein LOC125032601 n=1 Tax=Penaeus chinensis TaxID=139456 RepID=UPI001FB77576|nr:uncharacterized protein LOC125032601 [Penaeus chinensis]